MSGERQLPTCRAEHLAHRGHHNRGVAHHDDNRTVRPLDEQATVDGFGGLLGHRGQQDGLVGISRPGQAGSCATGDRDGQIRCHITDQGCRDTVQGAVLRPDQLRGGLLHRKKGCQYRHRCTEQSGDDGHEAGGSVGSPIPDRGIGCVHERFRMASTNGPMFVTVKYGSVKSFASNSTVYRRTFGWLG